MTRFSIALLALRFAVGSAEAQSYSPEEFARPAQERGALRQNWRRHADHPLRLRAKHALSLVLRGPRCEFAQWASRRRGCEAAVHARGVLIRDDFARPGRLHEIPVGFVVVGPEGMATFVRERPFEGITL
jgi:hypothetical protein